jgi:hypothetical protein
MNTPPPVAWVIRSSGSRSTASPTPTTITCTGRSSLFAAASSPSRSSSAMSPSFFPASAPSVISSTELTRPAVQPSCTSR